MGIQILLSFFLSFVLIASSTAAADEDPTLRERALETTESISHQIQRAARQLDLVLAGKKYTDKENDSEIKISQLVTWSEGGQLRTSTDFGINLRLPNLEKRWQLRFSSFDEREEERNVRQRRIRTAPREQEYGASFLFFFRELGNVKTTFQPRLELKDPLEMSYTLRFESSAEEGRLRLAPRLEFYADPNKGVGHFFSMDLLVELAPRWQFTFQNAEEYQERGNLFTTSHGITLDHALTDISSIGTGLTAGASNRPTYHLTNLQASVSYGRQILRDHLSYSLSPFLQFAKSRHFKGEAGVTLNIELVF